MDWLKNCPDDLEDNLKVCSIAVKSTVDSMIEKGAAKSVREACKHLADQDGKRSEEAYRHYYKRAVGQKLPQGNQQLTKEIDPDEFWLGVANDLRNIANRMKRYGQFGVDSKVAELILNQRIPQILVIVDPLHRRLAGNKGGSVGVNQRK